MTRIFTLVALAGFGAPLEADVLGLDMVVSTDGGVTWSTSAAVLPGSVVTVGIFARHDASVYGFAGAVVRINGTGLAAGDLASITGVDSRRFPFNFGASNQAVYASAGAFRIDNIADAGNSASIGVSITQRDPFSASNYVTLSPCLGYQFTVAIGAGGPEHDLALFLDQVKNGVMTGHRFSNSNSGSGTTDWSVTGASIHVVPGPASLAVVGLGGLLVGRRRR